MPVLQKQVVKLDVKRSNQPTLYRGGAEAARGAHNSEVTRSKRVSGIYHHLAPVHQGASKTETKVGLRDYKQSGKGLIERIQMNSTSN